MSQYVQIPQNEILPVKQFLSFFNITLEQYFLLEEVPFPVVTPHGRVVYPLRDSYYCYDMNTSDPSDLHKTEIDKYDILKDFYIDFATYSGHLSNKKKDFKHRFCRQDSDVYNLVFGKERITTQTTKSRTDIFHNLETGVCLYTNSLQMPGYQFTTLDIVNEVHPMRDQILSPGLFYGSYDEKLNTISVHSLTNQTIICNSQSTGNNTMTLVTTTIDKNKEALIAATKLEVGTIALDLITQQLIKALPQPFQLLIGESPLIKIAIANLANVMISQLSVEDQRLLAVNDAMLTVAYVETIRTFNFKEMIENALSNIPSESLALLTGSKLPA